MRQYQQLLRQVMLHGEPQQDRTGVGTLSIFGAQMRFNLNHGFPLVTTKKVHLKSVIHELLWFLRGDTNIKYLNDNGVHIWDEWANQRGELGPIYGAQWREWWPGRGGATLDQIEELIRLLKEEPSSRRQIVTAWNPTDLDTMALAPCHCLFQTRVSNGRLSLQVYQRSH